MRRVYVLCALILTVVVMDILLFHTGRAQAQQQQTGFRVDRITFWGHDARTGTAPVFGRIVGFDCVHMKDGPLECFVASSVN